MLFRCREDLTDKMFMLILLLVVILLLSLLLRFFLLAFCYCSICWQNVIVSDVVRISLLTKCFARPVKPPIGACLLPEFLAGSPFFKPQFLISHHSIRPAGEKGAASRLQRYWPNFQLNSCHFVSNIENSIKRPESERTNHCENISYSSRGSALCEVWGNFSREIQIPFCPTCHLVEQELKIWKVTLSLLLLQT